MHKANLNDDIDDFQINYVEDTKNISKICQTAKEECLLSRETYNKFRKILAPYATLASLAKLKKIKNKPNKIFNNFLKQPIDKIARIIWIDVPKFQQNQSKIKRSIF